MSPFTCCYKCEDRHLGCHSTCQKYITEKRENEKIKAIRKASTAPTIHRGDFLGDDGLARYRPSNYRRK